MEKQLLTNPEIIPERQVFEDALKDAFPVYEKMFSNFTERDDSLVHEWRYYKDGKAWLCKFQFRGKTIFWLSIWEGYFKISFYFVERQLDDFFDLPIDATIKEQLNQAKPFGKMFPVTLAIRSEYQLEDLERLVEFKKKIVSGKK